MGMYSFTIMYLFLALFGHAQTFILLVLVFPPYPTTKKLFMTMTKMHKR